MLRQYSTSTEWCINVCNSLVYLQWSTPCCSLHILVMYSTALAVSVSSLVLGLVLSQEGSGILPAGHEEILAYPYVDSFSCEGQAYGYYADVDSGCQVWWEEGRKRKKKNNFFHFFRFFTSVFLLRTMKVKWLKLPSGVSSAAMPPCLTRRHWLAIILRMLFLVKNHPVYMEQWSLAR